MNGPLTALQNGMPAALEVAGRSGPASVLCKFVWCELRLV